MPFLFFRFDEMTNVLITGNSSGLGLGLSRAWLARGACVYGLSRRGCPLQHADLHDVRLDLKQHPQISPALDQLLDGVTDLEQVVLNAGVLGNIQLLSDTAMPEIYEVMDINVWSNKLILDWLLARKITIKQIVLISSGAAISGNKGWGAYALSKATLNMLTRLYSHEFGDSQLIALAPGLVDTAMQDILSDPEQVNVDDFPTIQRLRDAKGTAAMPDPDQAAEKIIERLPDIGRNVPSGSFVDLRDFG